MKFNEEAMQKALAEMIKNEFWRDIYEGASETAKKRLRIAFWGSKYLDEKEDLDAYRECREAVECEMTLEDAAYLAERFPEGAGKEHYTKMKEERELAYTKTSEKLDAATEVLMEGWSDYDREMVAKTQEAIRKCDDPWVKYEWIWSAVGGNGEDCEWLGDTESHGHGVQPDKELAYFWFRRGAFCGHGDCAYRLAEVYEEEGPRFDMEKAKFWFAEALRRKSDNAKIDLGARLTSTEDGPWAQYRNPELGAKLLLSAIKHKHTERAHFFLAKCYENGIGIAQDLNNALKSYKIAEGIGIWGAKEGIRRVRKLLREEKKRDRERAEALAAAFGIVARGRSEAEVARACCEITPELKIFADCSDNEVIASVRIYLAAIVENDERE